MPSQNHFGSGLGIHDATGNTASCRSAFDFDISPPDISLDYTVSACQVLKWTITRKSRYISLW